MPFRVCTAICPLFSAPEAQAPRVDELLFGMPCHVLSAPSSGWVEVETAYRYRGFAQREHLAADEKRHPPEWDHKVLRPPFCDVLSAPDCAAPVLLSLPRGSILTAAKKAAPSDGGWQCVLLPDGQCGYVRSSAISPWAHPMPTSEKALRASVLSAALSYQGVSYRWGGKTPTGIDCSGLVSMAYLLNGIFLFRDAEMKPGFPVHPIPRSALQPADLLYWRGHVALYLGEGRYLHATAKAGSDGVVINSFRPASPEYRSDLAEPFPLCGSVF